MPAAFLLPTGGGGRTQAVVSDHTPRCRSRSSRCPASSAGGPSNTISPFDRIIALSAMRERARKSLSTMTVAMPSARMRAMVRQISWATSGASPSVASSRRIRSRVGHQRAADRQHLLLAAGELLAAVAAPLGEPREQREHPLQRPPAPPVAPRPRRHDQVLAHRQGGEDAAPLGHEGDAAARDRFRRRPGNIPRLQENRPRRSATRPMSVRISVVLPMPLRPSSATVSPWTTDRSTPCRTWLAP